MRILTVNTFGKPVGGAEIYALGLGDWLRERGHTVALFAGDPAEDVRQPERRLYRRPEFDPATLISDPALNAAFDAFARDFGPDVVHCHNLHTFPVDFVETAGRLGVPIVQTAHDTGMVCPNSWCVWPDGTDCPGGAGKKCFEHGCQSNYPYDGRVVVSVQLRTEAIRNGFEAWNAPSRYVTEKLASNGFDPVVHRPLWVPGEPLDTPPERRPKQAVFLGRLVREKGLEYLVRAWALVVRSDPDAELAIYGDGPERANLEALAAGLGLDPARIFRGKVPHSEVRDILLRATVQVLPSIWGENSPISCYECWLAGLPMIASRVGGLPELVREGETGLLARPRDPEHLAERIGELFGDQALQRRFQEGCLAAGRGLDQDEHVQSVLGWYERAIARGTSHRAPFPADRVAAAHEFFVEHAKLERWAGEMKQHIEYLEGSGAAGRPVRTLARHLRYWVKTTRK